MFAPPLTVAWCCRFFDGGAGRGACAATRPEEEAPRAAAGSGEGRSSEEERHLKAELEGGDQVGGALEAGAQVGDGLPEGIAVRTGRRGACGGEEDAHAVGLVTQAGGDAVGGGCREGGERGEGGGVERGAGEHGDEQGGEQPARHAVARKHLGQRDGEGVAAAAARAAGGAIDALAAQAPRVGPGGVVAGEASVPVQCTGAPAMRAGSRFEGKSTALRADSSGTKRTREGGIRPWCLRRSAHVEPFDGATKPRDSVQKGGRKRGRGGTDGTVATLSVAAHPNTTALRINHGTSHDGTAARNSYPSAQTRSR